mgnify:CR=1 FL=1
MITAKSLKNGPVIKNNGNKIINKFGKEFFLNKPSLIKLRFETILLEREKLISSL